MRQALSRVPRWMKLAVGITWILVAVLLPLISGGLYAGAVLQGQRVSCIEAQCLGVDARSPHFATVTECLQYVGMKSTGTYVLYFLVSYFLFGVVALGGMGVPMIIELLGSPKQT